MNLSVLSRTGDPSGGIPPDPIPNSAVKASSAYGTATQVAGESVVAGPAKDRHRITISDPKTPTEKSAGVFL